MKCWICGQNNDDNNIYCLNCGNPLKENNIINNIEDNLSKNRYDKNFKKNLVIIVLVTLVFIILASTITSDIVIFDNNTTDNTQYYMTNYTQLNNSYYPYIGNNNTQKFHYATCPYVQTIDQQHLTGFQTRDEAIQQGYSPCKQCNP